MVHQSQRLPLRLKPCDDRTRVHAELDDFERHPAAHRLFLLGHIDRTAPALPDSFQQLVPANPVAGILVEFALERARFGNSAQPGGRILQKVARVLGGVEQGFDATPQGGAAGTSRIEISRASFRRRAPDRLGEQHLFRGSGLHGDRFIAHTCANCQQNSSRYTKKSRTQNCVSLFGQFRRMTRWNVMTKTL